MRRLPVLLLITIAQLAPAQSIDSFFKETFEQMLRNDPEFATYVGRHDYDDRWTDWSSGARAERRQWLEQRLTALNGFSPSALSADNRLTTSLVRYDFRSRLEAWDLEIHLLRVGQLYGFHNRVYL